MTTLHWKVPNEWAGKRCFILGGGPSIKDQMHLIPKLQNPIIAINESIELRLDAEVAYWSDDGWFAHRRDLVHRHTGKYKISRRPPMAPTKMDIKVLARSDVDSRTGARGLSIDPRKLGGNDSGGSAINLAFLFGAVEIVLVGFDMGGAHWHNRYRNNVKNAHYDAFMRHINAMAPDLIKYNVMVWNTSPNSRLRCFPKVDLADFIDKEDTDATRRELAA